MKIKPIYLFALGAVLALNACKDDDLTAPSISLLGDASVVSPYGTSYSDAGAVASDDQDGDITSRIITSGVPDGLTAGQFVVEYNVSDDAGNAAATVTRDVTISYTGTQLAGTYDVAEICGADNYNYSINGAASGNGAYTVIFSNFGDVFVDPVTATIVGDEITIALQNPIDGSSISVQGTGTISINSEGQKVITMSYTVVNEESTTCTFTATLL